jgi:hypothetical protein
MSYRFADSLQGHLSRCQQTCMTHTIAVCTVKNSYRWTEELSETCRVSYQNKFEKSVHLVGFIITKLVTMHGHMNVKIYNVIVTANALVIIFFIIIPIWQLSSTFNTRSTRCSIAKNKQHTILISPNVAGRVQWAKNSEALGMFWHLDTHEESFKFRPAALSAGKSCWQPHNWILNGFQCSTGRDREEQLKL